MKNEHNFDFKYSKEKFYWGNKPHKLVVEVKKHLSQDSKILDLGCGEGQNANYLAMNGFDITAVDISKPGIEKLEVNAKLTNVQIKTEVADIIEYIKNTASFDAIICMNILQFIPANKINGMIERIKTITSIGGYNVISSFIAPNLEKKEKAASEGRYFFDKDELKEFYSDWIIIKYYEELGKWETHGEPKHRHHKVRLIAKRVN